MSAQPYPLLDYRVNNNRDRWHPCSKPWLAQCRDFANSPKAFIGQWSTPEGKREMKKRDAWYAHRRSSP